MEEQLSSCSHDAVVKMKLIVIELLVVVQAVERVDPLPNRTTLA